jgi:hypothetical protein
MSTGLWVHLNNLGIFGCSEGIFINYGTWKFPQMCTSFRETVHWTNNRICICWPILMLLGFFRSCRCLLAQTSIQMPNKEVKNYQEFFRWEGVLRILLRCALRGGEKTSPHTSSSFPLPCSHASVSALHSMTMTRNSFPCSCPPGLPVVSHLPYQFNIIILLW